MKVVGLTGSIAMGKSEVAQILRSVGVPVFDADAEVHKLYESPEGADMVRTLVPEAVSSGRVDRNILSTHVLADPELLAKLEQKVHMTIRKCRNTFIEQQRSNGTPLLVLDIPLLFETGSERELDKILVVSSRPELQRFRALARAGMTPEKLDQILKRQLPDEEKRKRADFIIENNGSKPDLREAVLKFLKSIKIESVKPIK